MEVLLLLIPLALMLVATALWVFVWAVDKNQFDDLDMHGMDIFDDARNDTGEIP